MKNWKNISMVLVLLILVSGLLAGCGGGTGGETNADDPSSSVQQSSEQGKNYNGNDISTPVQLKWFGVGGNQSDTDAVITEANKILAEKVNVTIEVDSLDWSDVWTKYSLVLASGEKVDVIYAAQWMDFGPSVSKGAFKELIWQILRYTERDTSMIGNFEINSGGQEGEATRIYIMLR